MLLIWQSSIHGFVYQLDSEKNGIPKKRTMDLLQFRTSISEHLINVGQAVLIRRKRGRPASSKDLPAPPAVKKRVRGEVRPSKVVRQDTVDHLPEVDAKKEATCCKNKGCNGKTDVFCTKCQVHLCLLSYRNCFAQYHT